nr:MAG TPA: hypothetical protein [Caudoviricetes sp.]
MPEFKDISQFSVVKPVGNEKIQVSATQSVTLQSIADLAPTADLSDYAKKTDLDSYAKKTDLTSINNDIDDLTSEVGTKKDKYNFKTMASGNFNISGGDILHINNNALVCTHITIKVSTFTDTNPIAYIIQPILNAGGAFNTFSFVFDSGSFDMYQVGYKEQGSIQSDGARLIKLIRTNLGFVLEYQYLTPYEGDCQ